VVGPRANLKGLGAGKRTRVFVAAVEPEEARAARERAGAENLKNSKRVRRVVLRGPHGETGAGANAWRQGHRQAR
jgi:hypothetical protein